MAIDGRLRDLRTKSHLCLVFEFAHTVVSLCGVSSQLRSRAFAILFEATPKHLLFDLAGFPRENALREILCAAG